jgi:aminocarboxymuconate-semialdehyde decarboxylase
VNPVVDVHAHALIPEAQLLVSQEAGFAEHQAAQRVTFGSADTDLLTGRWWGPLVDLDTRLTMMDVAGVDVQAVSVVPWQYYYWADRALAGELVDLINSGLARLVRRAPDRLVGVGTVALQHPDLAAEQLRRAVDDYDFRGVQISTRAGGRELSHPDLDPLWSIAESLGILVFVNPGSCELATDSPIDLADRPTEIALALSQLVFDRVLVRFPGLAVCAAHGGGSFPQSLERADHAYDLRPECRTTARRPSDYTSRLYFDSLVPHPDTLRRLADLAGPDRVLLGSDYPFKLQGGQPSGLIDTLPADERDAINGGNARTLLRLNGPTRPNRC